MNLSTLTQQDCEEALSEAYVQAVAARAGCTYDRPRLDRFGLDMTLYGQSGANFPQIGLQLKATIRLATLSSGDRSYPVPIRNYNFLRLRDDTPRLLVVLDLPPCPEDWLSVSVESLILRRCAYWVCLRGKPESSNQDTITMHLPKSQIFDVDAVSQLMERAVVSPAL